MEIDVTVDEDTWLNFDSESYGVGDDVIDVLDDGRYVVRLRGRAQDVADARRTLGV